MRIKKIWYPTVALLVILSLVPVASACPSCNAAVQETSGAEDEDRVREGMAYNQSIYLMVGMPYLLVGSVGFLIYRGTQLNALARKRMTSVPDSTSQS